MVSSRDGLGLCTFLKDPIILREMYCDKGLSLGEIAQLAGTTKSHVHYYMAKFDIDRRPWTGLAPKVDPSVILSLYKDRGKTLDQISIALASQDQQLGSTFPGRPC